MERPYTAFFESKVVSSTTTGADADVVYTVPANFDSETTLLVCTNGAAVNRINVLVYHADTAQYHYLVRNHSVAGNDTYHVLNSDRLYLHSGDKIVVYKGGGTFDVSVSGKHTYNPVRTI